jgi:hypothetical protein
MVAGMSIGDAMGKSWLQRFQEEQRQAASVRIYKDYNYF